MQNLKYKYRLYPTHDQEQLLLQACGSQRYIWNHFLASEQAEYRLTKKFKFYNQNSRDLTALKKTTNWLQDVPAVSLQQTIRNLDRALKQSFKKPNKNVKGFPKFKKKRNHNGSFVLTMVSLDRNTTKNAFYISRSIGDVKCIYHREIPSDFKSATIKQEAGKWFVVLTCKKANQVRRKIVTHTGVDLNSKAYVTTDNCFDIPKPLRESQAKIKKLQRKLSRCKKGSKNRLELQLKLQRAHQHISNRRVDYFHKLSRTLIDSYDMITIEDLDVKGIQQKFGRAIQDNGFGMFRQMLTYKAELYGSTLVVANRYFPSSQMCSACGGLTRHPLSERIFTCKFCNYTIDRDLNAAINLDSLGLEQTEVMPMDVTISDVATCVAVLSDCTNEVGIIL